MKRLILSIIAAGIFSTCHAATNSCQEQKDDINQKLKQHCPKSIPGAQKGGRVTKQEMKFVKKSAK